MSSRPRLQFSVTYLFLLIAPAFLFALIGCNATVRTVTREAQPLAYVGQVQLGEPTKEGGHVVVPLNYVGGEWGQNSAIVPIDVDATVKDAEVEITVITSVATENDANQGYKLILPEASSGEYAVYYRDPDGTRHQVGGVLIEE